MKTLQNIYRLNIPTMILHLPKQLTPVERLPHWKSKLHYMKRKSKQLKNQLELQSGRQLRLQLLALYRLRLQSFVLSYHQKIIDFLVKMFNRLRKSVKLSFLRRYDKIITYS